jgi:4'-phosphopantetheinyl transferase
MLRLSFSPAPDQLPALAGEAHLWRAELERPGRPAFAWALRHALSRYLGREPAAIELTAGEHGKPRLAGEELQFNLSHSGAMALIAVCEREVGVDVELVKPGRDLIGLAERAFAPADAAVVRGAVEAERAATFYRLWARHEARLKCLGTGLGSPLPPDPPPMAVETLEVGPGYAGAVAAMGGEPLPLRCWTFDPPLPDGGWRVS